MKLPLIVKLISDEEPLDKLLAIRMKEEMARLDGIPGLTPKEFVFFDEIKENKRVISAYETMQRQYVLRECDRISYEDVIVILENIWKSLNKNVAWNIAIVPDVESQNKELPE